jgi:hypothetical protein
MSKTVFVALLVLSAVAATAQAQVVIRGVLEAGPQPFPVDSTMIESRAGRQWFPCPEWAADPMSQDTFIFPSVPLWPEMIHISAFVEGQPVEQPFPQPRPDEWYSFEPPFEMTRVKFQELSGIEARPESRAAGLLSVRPTLVCDAAVISASAAGVVEIYDAAGNVVQTVAAPVSMRWEGTDQRGRQLAPGVYFCRLTGSAGTAVRRIVLAW